MESELESEEERWKELNLKTGDPVSIVYREGNYQFLRTATSRDHANPHLTCVVANVETGQEVVEDRFKVDKRDSIVPGDVTVWLMMALDALFDDGEVPLAFRTAIASWGMTSEGKLGMLLISDLTSGKGMSVSAEQTDKIDYASRQDL